LYMLLGGLLICLPAWEATHNAALLGGTICASALISYLFIAVHDAINHRDLHPFIAAQRWFRLLDDHHFIHHLDTETNVNFLPRLPRQARSVSQSPTLVAAIFDVPANGGKEGQTISPPRAQSRLPGYAAPASRSQRGRSTRPWRLATLKCA